MNANEQKLTTEDIHAVTYAYDWAKRGPVRAALAAGEARGLSVYTVLGILEDYRGEKS